MSLFDCIGAAMNDPDTGMDRARGEEAQRMFVEARRRYAREFGEQNADAMAAEDVKKAMRARGERKKRLALLQLQTARKLTRDVLGYRDAAGRYRPADALPALIEGDHVAGFDSVESVRKTLRGFYHGMIVDTLRTFGRNVLGQTRNRALMPDVVRGLHGETVTGPAGELAKAAKEAMNRARLDYNAAGGDIGEIEDWGLPHHWNSDRVAADPEAFKAALYDRLDWSRIIDHRTERPFAHSGKKPARETVTVFLDDVAEGIASRGWDTREPSFARPGLSVANRRAQKRILHFKSADDWMAMNETFGMGDPFAAIIAHLDGMARDTALMRVLGPNPTAGMEFAIQVAERHASAVRPYDGALNDVRKRAHTAKAMLSLVNGAANRPVDSHLAGFLAGTRHVLTAAQLGGAMLSAVSDAGFQYVAAREIGMDPTKVLGRMMKQLTSEDARMQALRFGVIADRLSSVGAAQARYLGEAWAPEVAERLSEFTMRASGLSAWTEAGRHAFQLEFMGFLAEHADRAFDALPDPLRRLFEQRGMTPQMWDQARAFDLHVDGSGATFMVPHLMREQAVRAAAPGTPPVKPGFVRMYHGGRNADGGPRWFTSSQTYAEGWAAQRGVPGQPDEVWYVDVPRSDPMFDAEPYQTVDQGMTVNKEFDPALYGTVAKLGAAVPSAPVDADTAERLAQKLMSIVNEQTEFAVPGATVRGRAAFGGEYPPGTFMGELARSVLMYKSFALSVMFNQMARIAARDSRWSKMAYIAQMGALLTVMGAVSVQMKELAKGRDPRPMDDRKFLAAAVLQGGGLGLFGDFFASETNRFGGGLAATLAGPVVGLGGDVIALGNSLLDAGTGGENARPFREAVRFARQYTPGASLWYANLAFQRMVFDNIQRWGDPDAEQSFRDRESMRRRDFGNESWWRPGDMVPERPPQFGVSSGP